MDVDAAKELRELREQNSRLKRLLPDAELVDEHTRESLLNIIERSITAERLTRELEAWFVTAGGPPMALRMDNAWSSYPKCCNHFAPVTALIETGSGARANPHPVAVVATARRRRSL